MTGFLLISTSLIAMLGVALLVFAALFIIVEERSHVAAAAANTTSDPAQPGTEGAAAVESTYKAWPLYGFWGLCIVLITICGSPTP